MDEKHSGACLCGAVRFRTRGALRGVVYCHCSQCRRQNGHFVAATSAKDADVDIEGAEVLSHIFVGDKGDYYSIDDGLPQFEKSSPSVKVAGEAAE
ncbi:MAG: hypothetical protein E5V40_17365 [Mesorhizobium sp.]|nr:MAG: hypothetical protein E5V40_17365 [Mesorhizobium sp.]